MVNKRAGKSNSLHLSAGELIASPRAEALEANKPEYLLDATPQLRFGGTGDSQTKSDVLKDAQVRKERGSLEDEVHRSLVRRNLRDVATTDDHLAARRADKARDDAKEGRLPAARWAEQRDEFAVFDSERDVVERSHASVAVRHVLKA